MKQSHAHAVLVVLRVLMFPSTNQSSGRLFGWISGDATSPGGTGCRLFTGHITLPHLRCITLSWISLFYGPKNSASLCLIILTVRGGAGACSESSLKVRDAASVRIMTATSMHRHTGACKHSHPWLRLGQHNEIWDHQLPLLSWLSSSSLFRFVIFSSLSPDCCVCLHLAVEQPRFLFVFQCVHFLPRPCLLCHFPHIFSILSILLQFSFPCAPILPAPPLLAGSLPPPWPARLSWDQILLRKKARMRIQSLHHKDWSRSANKAAESLSLRPCLPLLHLLPLKYSSQVVIVSAGRKPGWRNVTHFVIWHNGTCPQPLMSIKSRYRFLFIFVE